MIDGDRLRSPEGNEDVLAIGGDVHEIRGGVVEGEVDVVTDALGEARSIRAVHVNGQVVRFHVGELFGVEDFDHVLDAVGDVNVLPVDRFSGPVRIATGGLTGELPRLVRVVRTVGVADGVRVGLVLEHRDRERMVLRRRGVGEVVVELRVGEGVQAERRLSRACSGGGDAGVEEQLAVRLDSSAPGSVYDIVSVLSDDGHGIRV